MLISAEEIGVELPSGWDGRIRRRPRAAATLADLMQPPPRPLRQHLVTAHAANFSMATDDGDFGTRTTATMPRRGVFAALVEYQPGAGLEPGVGLYAPAGVPGPLAVADFDPAAMLRTLPGQAGVQRFFTAAERPFCLYAVIGSHRDARTLAPQVNALLAGVTIG